MFVWLQRTQACPRTQRAAQAQYTHDLSSPTSPAGFASFDGAEGATAMLLAKPKLNWLKIAMSCDTCLTDIAAGCGSAFSHSE